MPVLLRNLRMSVFVVLLCGVLVGVSGLNEPARSATDSVSSPDQGPPAVTPESPGGAGKARGGKGNHPMRKACAEDAKKLCADVKAGEGRIAQCLKQHTQELSQGCADMIQQRGKHRQ
ncbi:MAG: cysteine rich repeat-containing protein [Nitrospira sp.]